MLAIARTMAHRTRLLKRTVWNFIAGLLTGLIMLYLIASNERCLYDSQRELHNVLEDGRIPAKGTFLSLLYVKIVSLVMERIKHHNACYIKTKNNDDKSNYTSVTRKLLKRL